MISAKLYLGVVILGILTVQITSLPQGLSFGQESISFGGQTNANRDRIKEFQEEGEDCGDCLAPSLNFDCGTCATGLTCKRDERLPDAPGTCTKPEEPKEPEFDCYSECLDTGRGGRECASRCRGRVGCYDNCIGSGKGGRECDDRCKEPEEPKEPEFDCYSECLETGRGGRECTSSCKGRVGCYDNCIGSGKGGRECDDRCKETVSPVDKHANNNGFVREDGTEASGNGDSDQPRERRTQNCCCVSARSSCPNSRNQNSGGNGAFLNAASPRIKGANDNETTDDLDGFVSTRIVNNPTEFSQPQVQPEPYCEANERSCCYESSLTLNNIIRQSRCIPRSRPANRNVYWEQKCPETEPRRIRTGEKRCGERHFREIRGKDQGEANPAEFPWTCLVLTQNNDFVGTCAIVPDNRFNDVRGGTDRVIMAAHKLQNLPRNDQLKIRVIEYDASGFNQPEKTKHQEYVAETPIIHPRYDPTRLSYDLAVLKVQTRPDGFGGIKGRIDLTSTDDVNSACLPGCDNMFDYEFSNHTGLRCWVAGWGKDGVDGQFQIIQNKVDVPLMPRDDCQNVMQAALGREAGRNWRLSPSEICAGGEQGKDACDGDGGAPLVCLSKDNRWHVVGLVTWGVDCARRGVPGVYANIYHMRDFILAA